MKLTAHDMPRSYWRKVAEGNGVLHKAFNYRIRAGWPIDKAATVPSGVHARGGAKQLCRDAGLSEEAVYHYRAHRNGAPGLTDEQIVERLKAHHERVSISQLSRESGISRATISRRLRQGWTVKEATTIPPIPQHVSARMSRQPKGHAWAQKWEGVA